VLVLLLAAIGALTSGDAVVTVLEALPALTLVAVAVAGGAAVTALRPWLTGFAVLTALLVLGAVLNGLAWKADLSASATWVVRSVVGALGAGSARADGGWALGARWAAVGAGAVVLLWLVAVAAANLQRIDTAAWFESPSDVGVRPAELAFHE